MPPDMTAGHGSVRTSGAVQGTQAQPKGRGGGGSRQPGSSRKAGHRGLQMASRVALSEQRGQSQGRGPAVTPRDPVPVAEEGAQPPASAGRMSTQVPTQSSVTPRASGSGRS